MTKKRKASAKPASVADWVSNAKPRQHGMCYVCHTPEVRDAVDEFAKAKGDGCLLSWRQFYAEYLVPVIRTTISHQAVLNHVRNHVRGKA